MTRSRALHPKENALTEAHTDILTACSRVDTDEIKMMDRLSTPSKVETSVATLKLNVGRGHLETVEPQSRQVNNVMPLF